MEKHKECFDCGLLIKDGDYYYRPSLDVDTQHLIWCFACHKSNLIDEELSGIWDD